MIQPQQALSQHDPDQPELQAHCDLCGEHGTPYAAGTTYELRQCPRCAVIWSNPLTYEWLKHATDGDYWAEEVYAAQAEAQKGRFRRQLRVVLGRLNGRRVLEVGSGLGFFLDVCEEAGLQAEGCDTSRRAVEYANRKHERVRLGTLDQYYKSSSFDAVFAFNLLEHLPHPGAFLAEAHRVLKPGGILALETPVQEGLFHRLARVGYLASRGRLDFHGLNPGGHIYKFSLETFRVAEEVLGFRCLYSRKIESPFGEIWGKSALAPFRYRHLYRLVLPAAWAIARATGQGNRVFVLLTRAGPQAAWPPPGDAAPAPRGCRPACG